MHCMLGTQPAVAAGKLTDRSLHQPVQNSIGYSDLAPLLYIVHGATFSGPEIAADYLPDVIFQFWICGSIKSKVQIFVSSSHVLDTIWLKTCRFGYSTPTLYQIG